MMLTIFILDEVLREVQQVFTRYYLKQSCVVVEEIISKNPARLFYNNINNKKNGEVNMENNYFEQMAKKYDTEERIELAKSITKEVKPELQNSNSKSLLDFGGGTGLISLELSDLVDSVLLVDSSEQMLDIAETKITNKK